MNTRLPRSPFVSFDVFDTLLKRSVARPIDVFCLMEKLHREDASIPEGFVGARISAERTATVRLGRPAKIEQIYDVMRETYGDRATDWMKLEIQMELDGCRPNAPCVEFFRRCIQAGKTVVLISDMYLSSETIGEMLKKCGIEGYQKLYVSCEVGARKKDGTLFKVVLAELGIRPGQLLHVGDNKYGDFLAPISLGIQVRHVSKQQKRLCRIPEFVSSESAFTYRMFQAIAANGPQNRSEYERQGRSVLGPLLAGYSNWLAEQLCRDDIHDVYFFSRDGWMLMRAFDELHIAGIRSHYLYGSRRSYLVPTLWRNPEFKNVMDYIKRGKRMSLAVFLRKIGLDPEKYRERAAKWGLDLELIYEHDAFWDAEEVRKFYEEIREDVVRRSREEYDALIAYFRKLDMPERIAVADVGYTGTMQNAMQELIGAAGLNIRVKGYYIGIRPDALYVRQGRIQAAGYLHDLERNANYFELLRAAIQFYEVQFFKAQGSVEYFAVKDGCVEPVFGMFEYDVDDGRTVNEITVMDEYQAGALAFLQDLRETCGGRRLEIKPDAAIWNWLRLSRYPTLREAQLWGGFRVSNGDLQVLARPKSLAFYLLHPHMLKRDFLYSSSWKIGFMKQLLKLPLPYVKIYDALKKKYNA